MKSIYLILIIFLSIILLGCNDKDSKRLSMSKMIESKFINFKIDSISDSTFLINWGNYNEMNHKTRIFSKYEVLNLWESERTTSKIVLMMSSGLNNSNGLILDLNNDTSYYLLNLYAWNISTGIVAFKDNNDCKIRFQNIYNNKFLDIKCEDPCPAIRQSDCIKKICFFNNSAFIIWEGSNWSSINNDYRVKEIHLDDII